MGLRALLAALGERGQGLRFLSLAGTAQAAAQVPAPVPAQPNPTNSPFPPGCSVDGPSDATTWAKITSLIQDLRLCGRRITQRGDTGDTGTLARHRKLFCKSR